MTLIYRIIFCLLAIPALVWGANGNTIKNFLLRQGIPDTLVSQWTNPDRRQKACAVVNDNAVCFRSEIRNTDNANTAQVLLKILAMQVKNDLASYIIQQASYPYRDKQAIAYLYQNGPYKLAGLQFSTAENQDWLAATALVQLKKAQSQINTDLASPQFKRAYCNALMRQAQDLFAKKDYAAALNPLKELHDLKWAQADAYILAADTFYRSGMYEDARQIALETLRDLANQLTPELAEKLGDILLNLKYETEAVTAYNIAIQLNLAQ